MRLLRNLFRYSRFVNIHYRRISTKINHYTSRGSKIIESNSITNINYYIKKDCKPLVIFDIDNTLAYTKIALGSDEWFEFIVDEHTSRGMQRSEAIDYVQQFHTNLHDILPLHPVEGIDTIKTFNELATPILGLTARPPTLSTRTHAQLTQIGIDFMQHPTYNNHVNLSQNNLPAIYDNNIIFSGRVNKADSLCKFLEHTSLKPEKIIFIDDKLKHINKVYEKIYSLGIAITCIHYKALHYKSNKFTLSIAIQEACKLLDKIKQTNPTHYNELLNIIKWMKQI